MVVEIQRICGIFWFEINETFDLSLKFRHQCKKTKGLNQSAFVGATWRYVIQTFFVVYFFCALKSFVFCDHDISGRDPKLLVELGNNYHT